MQGLRRGPSVRMWEMPETVEGRTMSVESVEAMITADIETVRADGWTLATGHMGSADDQTCCALGASLVVLGLPLLDTRVTSDAIDAHLGTDWSMRADIASGFDGDPKMDCNSPHYYRLGARLRARYVEQPTEPCADGCAAEQGEDQ